MNCILLQNEETKQRCSRLQHWTEAQSVCTVMCVCVCVSVCVHICVCVCVFLCVGVFLCVYSYVCGCVCVCFCVCVSVCVVMAFYVPGLQNKLKEIFQWKFQVNSKTTQVCSTSTHTDRKSQANILLE